MDTHPDTDANGLEVLSRAESIALLETQEVGRLVYTRRALPAVIPVNFVVRDDAIFIWTGSSSSLAQALRGSIVAFETDELDRARHAGWSVSVTGPAHVVTDPQTLRQARVDGPRPWAGGRKDHLIRIPLAIVAGRRLGVRQPARHAPLADASDARIS